MTAGRLLSGAAGAATPRENTRLTFSAHPCQRATGQRACASHEAVTDPARPL
jgi:hypothetical protein